MRKKRMIRDGTLFEEEKEVKEGGKERRKLRKEGMKEGKEEGRKELK